MKTLIACSFGIAALISVTSFANPHGGFGGAGHGNAGFGPAMGAMPPGLRGTPPGLKMLNKTPSGWSHGRKEGWGTNHHYHHNHNSIIDD